MFRILVIFVAYCVVTKKFPTLSTTMLQPTGLSFFCAKDQSILLLEFWHKPYYKEFGRFILLASFDSSCTSHSEITTKRKGKKKKKGECLWMPLFCVKVATRKCKISHLMYTKPGGFCKSVIPVHVKWTFIRCFTLWNSFRRPRLGTYTCLPRKHVFQRFPGENGMSLKLFPLLRAKSHTEPSFLTCNCPYALFRISLSPNHLLSPIKPA